MRERENAAPGRETQGPIEDERGGKPAQDEPASGEESARIEPVDGDQEPPQNVEPAARDRSDGEPDDDARSAPNDEPADDDARTAGNAEPADDERSDGEGTTAGDEEPADEPAAPQTRDGAEKSRKPISSRAKVLVVAMSALLGFGIVIQVRQTQEDEFSALRQDDLVRLLDEVTQRNEDLAAERDQLLRDRASLRSGSDSQRLAQEYQLVHGVLAGTEPVEGPGVVVSVRDADEVSAQTMVHMLEELRNAGAEAVEVSGQRLVASSAFVDTEDGVLLDNQLLTDPIEWRAIGNAQTMAVALDIPGGALAGFRNAGATVEVEERTLVQITAIREAAEPEFAEPAEPEE